MLRLLFTFSHPALLVGFAMIVTVLMNDSLTFGRLLGYLPFALLPAAYWLVIVFITRQAPWDTFHNKLSIKGSLHTGERHRLRLALHFFQLVLVLLVLLCSLLFIVGVTAQDTVSDISWVAILFYPIFLVPFLVGLGVYLLAIRSLTRRGVNFNEHTAADNTVPLAAVPGRSVWLEWGIATLVFLGKPLRWWWHGFCTSKQFRQRHYAAVLLVLLAVAIYFAWIITRPVALSPDELRTDYELVRDTVPMDGPIVVRLPEGEGKFLSRFQADFDPDIRTWWGRTTSPDHIVFKLREPLEENNFYTLSFTNSDGSVTERRFRAVQRPRIDLFEPSTNLTDVQEDTILTFTFNRPMVPLQSLDREYEGEIPIIISPPTEGSFVWVSERQLEFIPATRLTRSSDYTVTVGEGFYSVDGLQIPTAEYNFTVKPLRSYGYRGGSLRSQDPLQLSFNQPVAIDDMQVVMIDQNANPVSVTLEHPSTLTYNPELERKENVIDRSSVVVRPVENDGRWLFGDTLRYELKNIRPLEGVHTVSDIVGTSTVANLLMRSEAYSPRSEYVTKDYFDPEGLLRLYFSQPIDKERLKVEGKGFSSIEYQNTCPSYDTDCGDYNDTVIEISFDPATLALAESFSVIVTDFFDLDGVRIANVREEITVTTVGGLQIPEVIAGDKTVDRFMTVCSTNPLIQYRSSSYQEFFQTEQPVESFSQTGKSSYVRPIEEGLNPLRKQPECAGLYKTLVQYDLLPETEYTVQLTPVDVFGNRATSTPVSFTTPEREVKNEEIEKVTWMKNLHQRYEVTTPERTDYTYSFGNIDYIDVSICKLSPKEMLKVGGELGRGEDGPSNCIERQDRRIDLNNPDGTSYLQLDLQEYFSNVKGHYVITMTHPELTFQSYENRKQVERQYFDHMYTSVTTLSLVEKRTNQFDLSKDGVVNRQTGLLQETSGNGLYWVSDLSTLDPVVGAQVTVYRDTAPGSDIRIEQADSTITDSEGIGFTKTVPDAVGAYVTYGDDSALVSSWADKISYAGSANEIEKVYVYTDRPIYRPGHEVFIKGLHRIGYDAVYEVFTDQPVTIKVSGPKGEIFATTTLLSEYGTVATDLVLAEDAPLGTYQITALTDSDRGVGYTSFSVEEYKPSPFEVKATSPRDEYIAGETMDVAITADYFFGAPVTSGTVTYAITSQDYYFDKANDNRFRYGTFGYRCYWCQPNNQSIARGELQLENGVADLSTELDFDVLFEDEEDSQSSKIFVINATVTDANGRSVSTQSSFIVHRASRYGAIRTREYFTAASTTNMVDVRTVDVNGVGQSETVEVEIVREEWKQFERREVDGSYYVHSEEVEVPVFATSITTDAQGQAEIPFVFDQAGRYVLRLSGDDERGNPYVATGYQYVYGQDSVPIRRNNDRTLDIAVDETSLDVGETSKLIIQSPYERAKALVTVERGRVMEYEVIDVDANFFAYDFTAKTEHAPNVVVTATLISNEPAVKYGSVRYAIDRDVYNLDINVTSNKSAYLPGEEVTLQVFTRDNDGIPVPAEVSIAAVDLSVLALKGNPKKDPLGHFYSQFSHDVITSSNLKFVHEEIEIPEGTKGGDGGVDLAKRERGTFKDTAFWAADVVTDAAGRATVTFTLPDNLTRWQVETIGITKDTKVGVDYMEFEEKKDLITTPLYPRFLVPGDKLSLGAEVLNLTNFAQTITFGVESDTLIMIDNVGTQTVTIPAGGSERLFVDVEAPRTQRGGEHEVRFVAGNSQFEDAVRKQIPVKENTLYETVFRSGQTSGELIEEDIFTPTEIHEEAGGVTVKAFGTVGAYLEDSLNYMAAYPYGCSEQLASKLATLATVRHLTSLEGLGEEYQLDTVEFRNQTYSIDEALQQGLKQIYETQNGDGGFGYYRGLHSDVSLSLHVLSVLLELQNVGVEVNDGVLRQAEQFAITVANDRENESDVVDRSWRHDYLTTRLVRLQEISPRPRAVDVGVAELQGQITRTSIKYFSTHALVHAALLSDELWWWDRRTVWKEVDRRLRVDTDGVYISRSPVSFAKSFYETDSANTAVLLQAIAAHERETEQAPMVVDWLLAQRQFDGAWGTTNTTHVVVQSLTDYITWKGENEARTIITALLDGEVVATHNTELQSKLEGLSAEFTYEDLGLGQEHRLTFTQTEADSRQDNTIYYDIAMQYYLDREVLPGRDEGVQVTREFFALEDIDKQSPLDKAAVGDTVVGRVIFSVGSPMRMMALEDKIPAGFEIINFDFSTENRIVLDEAIRAATEARQADAFDVDAFIETDEFALLEAVDVYKDEKEALKPNRRQYVRDFTGGTEELHDDRLFVFSEQLRPGTYVYEYYLRALVPGQYQHLPVWVGEMYNPEFFGRTPSGEFTVTP